MRIIFFFQLVCLCCLYSISYGQSGNFGDPIIVPTSKCGNSVFSDYKNTANSIHAIGQPSPEVCYSFTLLATTNVIISTCGSNFDTYLWLMNDSYGVIATNDDSGPACTGMNASLFQVLGPGTYNIIAEGSAENYGELVITINTMGQGEPAEGANMLNALNAGTFNKSGSYSDTRGNGDDCLGNDIGNPANDIYYKFTLGNTAEVMLSNCGSNVGTSMYLLDASGNLIVSNSGSNESPCTPDIAYIKTTLSAGTYYVASEGGTGNIKTSINVTMITDVASWDQNYVLTYTPRKSGMITSSAVVTASSDPANVQTVVEYYDGLGRPMQTVQIKGNGDGTKDFIQPFAYDNFGRESLKYLPYTTSGLIGRYRSDALKGTNGYSNSAQKTFYGMIGQGYKNTNTPHSLTVFEPSPIARTKEQGAPGDAWQPISGSGNGHTIKTEYGANVANEVKLWAIFNNSATSTVYPAGKLYKTVLKDENWVSTDIKAGTVEEFRDFKGKVVLKRVWETSSKSLSTYYLYDKFDNLRYVLPPAVNENGESEINTFDETQDVFDKYIYGYYYDGNQRVIKKKIPGKGWEEFVYNKLDQVVLTRDAVQRDAGRWFFTKYDALGRTVLTGIITSSTDRPTWQADVNAQTYLWEGRDNANSSATGTGYTNNVLPVNNDVLHYYSINYYDNYDFYGNSHAGPLTGESVAVHGLPVGSKTNVLNGNTAKLSTMLLSTSYYDEDGKVVRTKNQNHMGGTDEVLNVWNFAKELTLSTRKHTVNGTITIANRYEYDHIGRKKGSYMSINGQNEVALSKLEYNEIGQLKTKWLHGTYAGQQPLSQSVTLGNGDVVNPGENRVVMATNSITLGDGFHAKAGSFFVAKISDGTFLQHTDFAYNERGWLKSSVSDEFSFKLDYEDGIGQGYNGNITKQEWGTGTTFPNVYSYTYDKLDRLTNGASSGVTMSEILTYDPMGNIKTMNRDALGVSTYDYVGNKLSSIISGPLTTATYSYDVNGNATYDGRTGMGLSYNFLNLPKTITKTGVDIAYTYDATGDKLKKVYNGTARDYVSGIEYMGSTIDVIHTEEGLARNSAGTYTYEYNLNDHLGNVRYSFNKHPTTGALQRLQSDDYYAFGKRKSVSPVSLNNKYLYNGKEIQDELNSTGEEGQYDFGARFYDPVIARWNVIDNMAEKYNDFSTYNYAINNPVNLIDPDGNDPTQAQEKLIAQGYQLMFYRHDAMAGKFGPMAQMAEYQRQHFVSLRHQLLKEYFGHGGRYPESGGAGRNVSSFGGLMQKVAGIFIRFTPFGAIGAVAKAGRQGNVGAGILAGIGFFAQMGSLASLGGTTVRAPMYSGVRSASNYLQELGVERAYRLQIIQSFRPETISLQTAGNSTFGLRFYGGTAQATGRYLFPTFTETTNRVGLALPTIWNNEMSGIAQFQVKPGSIYIYGRAASQGGIFTGGNNQMYVPNLKNLKRL